MALEDAADQLDDIILGLIENNGGPRTQRVRCPRCREDHTIEIDRGIEPRDLIALRKLAADLAKQAGKGETAEQEAAAYLGDIHEASDEDIATRLVKLRAASS
jgi:hypothetical protein